MYTCAYVIGGCWLNSKNTQLVTYPKWFVYAIYFPIAEWTSALSRWFSSFSTKNKSKS